MKRISLLFCALVAMSTVMYGAKKKQPKQQLWPDGSVMSECFYEASIGRHVRWLFFLFRITMRFQEIDIG